MAQYSLILITIGYMTPEALDVLAPYMDAFTVDIKGSANP
jgi:pyruvate-formate lyase-activating enzyme